MKKDILNDVVKKFAGKCYRTILVAHSEYSQNEWQNLARKNNNFDGEDDRETVESGLCLIGIFGL